MLLAENTPEFANILTLIETIFKNSSFSKFIYTWESIIFAFFIACALSLLFFFGSRAKESVPKGVQNFLEWIVETLRIYSISILGKEGEKYIPFLGTLFIYILSMNLLGLIPLMASPTSDLNVTAAMALCVFFFVQYLNIKNMGIKGFFYHLMGSPKNLIGWCIAPLMLPIEIITQISRPVTLALRLFGNILGEKTLIAFFAMIGIAFLYFFPIQLPFMFLGLLTSFMQAMVFTLLTSIYILFSVQHSKKKPINLKNEG